MLEVVSNPRAQDSPPHLSVTELVGYSVYRYHLRLRTILSATPYYPIRRYPRAPYLDLTHPRPHGVYVFLVLD